MEVILRQHVDNLGRPVAHAERDPDRRERQHVARERKILETREAEEKSQAESLAARLASVSITITRRVGETEQLYGSVTASDIAEFLKAKGFEIDRRRLILPEPIKAIGDHDVPLKLHREVTVPLKVHVVKEGAPEA